MNTTTKPAPDLFDLGVARSRAHAAAESGQLVAKPDPVSDTPKTEAKTYRLTTNWGGSKGNVVPADFARELERRCARLEFALRDAIAVMGLESRRCTARRMFETAGGIDSTIETARAALADDGQP